MEKASLSIVVIGRNESAGLAPLIASLAPLRDVCRTETLFVDSASTDDSVEIARAMFDVTIALVDDENLSASAGRFIGAGAAQGDWLLFLDGDMILRAEFVDPLLRHIAREQRRGLVGNYQYIFDDGSTKVVRPATDRHGRAQFFGGAVLLPAAALQLENWDPRLSAYEEIDLYARLRSRGWDVLHVDTMFISHFTRRYPSGHILRGLFFRADSHLGKKFLGFGQLLAAHTHRGSLAPLARCLPEPFVLWGSILLAVLLAGMGMLWIGVASLAIAALFVSVRKSPKYVIIYLSFLPQAFAGFRAFRPSWSPRVQVTLRAFTQTSGDAEALRRARF